MRLHFTHSDSPKAVEAAARLIARYTQTPEEEAEVIVPLGGDGFMIQMFHRYIGLGKGIYGMNCGTVGFLMNPYNEEDLPTRILRAPNIRLPALKAIVRSRDHKDPTSLYAFNEVSILRKGTRPMHARVDINDKTRLNRLIGDGIILATPAGSTAYNLSAHGPVLPIGSRSLALTPLAPYHPRNWRGAVLEERALVHLDFEVTSFRPVSLSADALSVVDNIESVTIRQSETIFANVIFEETHDFERRILDVQFPEPY